MSQVVSAAMAMISSCRWRDAPGTRPGARPGDVDPTRFGEPNSGTPTIHTTYGQGGLSVQLGGRVQVSQPPGQALRWWPVLDANQQEFAKGEAWDQAQLAADYQALTGA